jgi:hypothetical protein
LRGSIEALHAAAQIELIQLGEGVGLDLNPPNLGMLSDLALRVGKAFDQGRG